MNPERSAQEMTEHSRDKLNGKQAVKVEEGSLMKVKQFVPEGDPLAPAPLAMAGPMIPEKRAPKMLANSSSDKSKNQKHKRKFPEVQSSSSSATEPPTESPLRMQFAPAVAPAAPVPLAMVPEPVLPSMKLYEERGLLLIKLLQCCAAALADGKIELVNAALDRISVLASPDGDPMQRLASSFAEALALRVVRPWQGVCRALQLRQPTPAKVAAAARHNFAVMCPFLRLAAAAANHAIVEATQPEMNVDIHVVDLGGADPNQWLELIRLFAARPEGAPHCLLRLTVVNEQDEFLSATAALLAPEAERLNVRFQFHPVKSHIDELLTVEPLGIRSGQTLSIVSTLQLHRLLADEFAPAAAAQDKKGNMPPPTQTQQHAMTRANALLRDLRELSPKLMVIMEQEADHNGTEFTSRFWNALNYYGAMFDALEESAPRGSVDRACVERYMLREEIRDIVACDGAKRRERHERMERWAARMDAAGFAPVKMSCNAVAQTARLARQLSTGGRAYRLSNSKDGGCFFLNWHSIPMFSISTWQPRSRRMMRRAG